MSRREALAKIQALLDSMETCHVCGGTLALDDVEPTHCENCSWDCEEHDAPTCTPLYHLHQEARRALVALYRGVA